LVLQIFDQHPYDSNQNHDPNDWQEHAHASATSLSALIQNCQMLLNPLFLP
jgi:hypothetical protein